MGKKIPWWSPQIGPHEYTLVKQVLDANYINEGEFTTLLEDKIAKLLKVKHVISVTSGTTAVFLALKALNIEPGDEVIVPDITFIATANAVKMCSAVPVLVDVEANSLNLDPLALQREITPRTKAVIPVHVSGRAARIEEILKIAKERKIFVIEDAAEAFMSKYKGKFLGTFGELGCFSLSPNKTITSGQGGFISTNNSELHTKLVKLKDHGRPVRGTGGNDIHESIGFNFKYTNLQAAIALGQLTYLKTRIQRMRRNHKLYLKYLKTVPGIKIFEAKIAVGELPQWTDALVERRDELVKFLREKEIESREFWFPLHTQAPYKEDDSKFPVSTRLYSKALWLPSAFNLTDHDIKKVCDQIKNFYFLNQTKLSIVLPVNNEGANIELMVKMIEGTIDVEHEIVVVYDLAKDNTIPVVENLQNKFKNLKLVLNKFGRGVANAIKAGVKESKGEYVLILAADDTGPVLAINEMVELMDQGCDLVSGSRYAHGGRRLGGSIIGGILSKMANRILNIMLKSSLTDSTTGLKMFKRSLLDEIEIESNPIGWTAIFELSLKVQALGKKIGEVPFVSIDRLYGGKSTFKLGPWFNEYFRWFLWGIRNIKTRRQEIKIIIPKSTALN